MLSHIHFSSVYCYTISNRCHLLFTLHQFIATISRINVISYSLMLLSVYCYTISNWYYLLFTFHPFIATISRIYMLSLIHFHPFMVQYLESMLSLIHFHPFIATLSRIDIISYSLFISLLLHYHESKKTDKNMYYNGTLLIPTKIAVSWEEELMFIVGWLMLFSLEKSKFLESSTVCYDSHIIHVINFFFFSLKHPWSFISSLWYCTKYNQLSMMQMQ